MLKQRDLHIVQTSFDSSLFFKEGMSDALSRQLVYAREVERLHPGSRITVIVLTRNAEFKEFSKENVRLIPLYFSRKYQAPLRLYRMFKILYNEFSIHVIATQTVHEDGWIALLFARKKGIPVVGQIHYDIFSSVAQRENLGGGLKGLAYLFLLRFFIPRFYAVRVVGQRIKRELLARKLHNKVFVIPVPVYMNNLIQLSIAQLNPIRKVLFVGRLVSQKRLDIWLQVALGIFKQDPTVKFEIVGDGPLYKNLRRMAKKMNLDSNVNFRGYIPYNELSEIYNSAAVFLLTSSYEGFGRVIVEAYFHKLPVVASQVAGVEDIIENNKTGFILPVGDREGMVGSVIRLLNNAGLRRQMGEDGYDLVREQFKPSDLTRRWVALLLSAAKDVYPHPCIIPPLRATWKRWRAVSTTRYSLLRGLQYEKIKGLYLKGRTLDIGGGCVNSYYDLLKIDGLIESINIDFTVCPSMVADGNFNFPIKSNSYDNVICFNSLEHIRNDVNAITEALRILKPGGFFCLTMPFLYRVHGSPNDYHRHTALWWFSAFLSQGVKPENILIEPLVWDPVSSSYSFIEYQTIFRGVIKKLVMLYALYSQSRLPLRTERLPENLSRLYSEYALGYFICGKK